MGPDQIQLTAARVATTWVEGRREQGLWQEFLDDVYEGGHKLVRNTNRDTRDRHPQVEAGTLLRTDRKFRKLLRGQFGKWRERRERQGPPGDPVTDLGQLESGQKLEWTQNRSPVRGVVERAKPDRAILRLDDGQKVHMRPWDIEAWQPRVRTVSR